MALVPCPFSLPRRAVFPLNELLISAVLIVLIAGALYFFAGVWGTVLLWALGVLALLPLGAAPAGLFLLGIEKAREASGPVAAAYLLGSTLAALAWLAAVSYCAYRAYLAVP